MIKQLISRFNELYSIFGSNLGGGKAVAIIDWGTAFMLHGASFYDYFAYRFDCKNYRGRSEYMTWRKHSKIQKVYNDPHQIDIMRDKEKFNQFFKDYLGRESLELKGASKDEFADFFKKHGEIFVKDIYGLCGKNIRVYNIKECDPYQLYDMLTINSSINYLIENTMQQHKDLAQLHPWSINTIRIVTLYNKKTDNVHIVCARQRIGNNRHRVDNFHYEGLCAVIDVETGIISSVGYDKNSHEYVKHPLTNEVIPGFQEPNWEACKEFICKVARMVPDIGYVGWDIVVQQDGTFALIEGNDNADHDVQQVDGRGIWSVYKKLLMKGA